MVKICAYLFVFRRSFDLSIADVTSYDVLEMVDQLNCSLTISASNIKRQVRSSSTVLQVLDDDVTQLLWVSRSAVSIKSFVFFLLKRSTHNVVHVYVRNTMLQAFICTYFMLCIIYYTQHEIPVAC